MAGGMDLGGGRRGGKRSLDTAINLVPFIDLMAVTISFLIMTAVWNQIDRLAVTQPGAAPPGETSPAPTLPITLAIAEGGLALSNGTSIVKIDKVDGRYRLCHAESDTIDDACEENTLISELKKLKATVPDQRSITLQVEDGVSYDDLIRVIDICNMKDGSRSPVFFPDVAVAALG